MDVRSNVTVRNGTIRGFDAGIREFNDDGNGTAANHRISDLRLIENVTAGVALDGTGHLVTNCLANDNGGTGILVSEDTTVTGNTANGNGVGIGASRRATLTGNTTNGNVVGIGTGSASTASGNTSNLNSRVGISGGRDSTVTGNTANGNGEAGIFAFTGTTVTGNTANNNDKGIDPLGNNVIVGNTAVGNTTAAIDVCPVNCEEGFNRTN